MCANYNMVIRESTLEFRVEFEESDLGNTFILFPRKTLVSGRWIEGAGKKYTIRNRIEKGIRIRKQCLLCIYINIAFSQILHLYLPRFSMFFGDNSTAECTLLIYTYRSEVEHRGGDQKAI